VDLWGFDGDLLQAVADRVGPTVADLATQMTLDEIPETFSWSLARPVPLATRRSSAPDVEAGASPTTGLQVAAGQMTG
jgi:hypothetical protein